MIFTFPKIVKKLLARFPKRDYQVLNTRLFVSCWLGFVLDQSLQSMHDLFRRLHQGGVTMDISTFSKANQNRDLQPFQELYQEVLRLVKQKSQKGSGGDRSVSGYEICPIDSTVITLTSKLLWALGYHQVKLISVFNNAQGSGECPLINFGQDHDYKFATQMTENLSENQVGIMDRGFAALEYLKQLQAQKKLFVIRVNSNYKLEPLADGSWQVGTGERQGIYRVLWFCDLETKAEYRLVTNLPEIISNEEVAEIYRQHWQIKLFWKFICKGV